MKAQLLAVLLLGAVLAIPTEVFAQDRDDDGLPDDDETTIGTDPDDPDSDGGGELDGDEVDNGRDPLDDSDDFGDSAGPTPSHFILGGQDCSAALRPTGGPGMWTSLGLLAVPLWLRGRRRRGKRPTT